MEIERLEICQRFDLETGNDYELNLLFFEVYQDT